MHLQGTNKLASELAASLLTAGVKVLQLLQPSQGCRERPQLVATDVQETDLLRRSINRTETKTQRMGEKGRTTKR